MFSWFKKKKERDFFAQVQSSIKEFEDATNSHMEFMRSHENDINTTTIGSGEVSIEFINGEKNGLAKPYSREDVSTESPNFSIDNFIEVPKGLGKSDYTPSVRGKRIVINDKNQSAKVESIIREKGFGLTPPEVEEIYNKLYDAIPLTSIRRALTKLTDEGVLVMTGEKRKGKYNKMNFVWSLKNN